MALLRPIASRVVALVPVVLGITVLVWALNAIALGDPARAAMGQRADPETLERLRREYALDRPLPVQYATWLGRLALVFAVTLGWLPVSGYGDGALRHLVLPAVTLGALHTGTVARMTRSSLLEVVRQDFMATARAKGLSEWAVLGKHALRNALVPVVTVIGIGLADLLVAAPLTETVFAWPGVGRLLVA